jgi:hypothetical protein
MATLNAISSASEVEVAVADVADDTNSAPPPAAAAAARRPSSSSPKPLFAPGEGPSDAAWKAVLEEAARVRM